MNTEQIGAFICQIRKEKCLTQEQLAEKVGVSQRTVSRWETGTPIIRRGDSTGRWQIYENGWTTFEYAS